jgi:hypothetical protein
MRRLIFAFFGSMLLIGCSSTTAPSSTTSVTMKLLSATNLAGDAAGFTYSIQIAPGESARSLSIAWGDGETQSLSIPTTQATTMAETFNGSVTHTFRSRGSFSVMMTLTDSTGASTQSSAVVVNIT